jgi:hypothetical protein
VLCEAIAGLQAPIWFKGAIFKLINEAEKNKTANKTRRAYTLFRSRSEHLIRAIRFGELVQAGVSPAEARRVIASERAKTTGVHVTSDAIRKSCERAARLYQRGISANEMLRVGFMAGSERDRTRTD